MVKIKGMDFPLDRKYYVKNGAHTWLRLDGKIIKIGLDAFATQMAGPIDFLIVNKGQIKINKVIGNFESNKFVSKIYSPISGEIIDVNNDVIKNPIIINNKPYESWIVKIKPYNPNIKGKYIIEGKTKITNWISKEIKRLGDGK